MNNNDLIKEVFSPLMTEYGYNITSDIYSPEFMGNAAVVFVSDKIGIRVVVDRSQVVINIGSSSENEYEWFDFADVIHFYAPRIKEVYLFERPGRFQNAVDSQLRWLLHLFQKYCGSILRGNTENFDQIKVIEINRIKELLETYKKK